jgi:anti-sigma factor RsiW
MTDGECKNVFALLSQYLDEELPADACEELEHHIEGCEPCIEFVESLKKSVAVGRGYKPAAEPPPLPPDVRQSLKEAYARMLAERKK